MNEEPIGVHTGCRKCQPGEYYNETISMCWGCDIDTITSTEGSTECIPCGEDMHSNDERTECLPGARIKEEIPMDGVMPGVLPLEEQERLREILEKATEVERKKFQEKMKKQMEENERKKQEL